MHLELFSTTASPGDGITEPAMSEEPLATEGEATPGPDDWNPFDEMADRDAMERYKDVESETISMGLPDFAKESSTDETELPPLW